MDNFIFHNPTRLIFGKGMIAQLSQQIPADKRIMITFGGGKIDLVLQKLGAKKVDDFSEVLLQYIKDHEGFTPLNDKSAAEDIYDAFGVSKKTFKKAVGDLYKKRLVVLEAEGIRLT